MQAFLCFIFLLFSSEHSETLRLNRVRPEESEIILVFPVSRLWFRQIVFRKTNSKALSNEISKALKSDTLKADVVTLWGLQRTAYDTVNRYRSTPYAEQRPVTLSHSLSVANLYWSGSGESKSNHVNTELGRHLGRDASPSQCTMHTHSFPPRGKWS